MPAKKSNAQIEREVEILTGRRPPGDGGMARAREVSERRIAALIANGEDARDTPAWRDAMSEIRTIDLMSSWARMLPSEHTRVDIRWYAIPNKNQAAGGLRSPASGGFLPMIEENGKARGDTWSYRGYSKADAEAMAEKKAHDAASRFVGDWNVTVTKGRPTRR